jgi:uncharacterized membrane protein
LPGRVSGKRFDASEIDAGIECPHVHVPAIAVGDMLDKIFAPIERDGAGMVEVNLRLQMAFLALVATDSEAFGVPVARHFATALERAGTALTLEQELHAVQAAAARVSASN